MDFQFVYNFFSDCMFLLDLRVCNDEDPPECQLEVVEACEADGRGDGTLDEVHADALVPTAKDALTSRLKRYFNNIHQH